ncbi:hypothetical protein CL633_04350 [bacterium]|nr:hypothetical protein [bacterium]|tara:strand:+ start:8504 stop:8821 length:318 start_codon:yes stop_codon:yes gene_type:complete
MAIYLLSDIVKEEGWEDWKWIADDKKRIFCARAGNHGTVFNMAQKDGFKIEEREMIGGGEFIINYSDNRVSLSMRQLSASYGEGPEWAKQEIKEYFKSLGWAVVE